MRKLEKLARASRDYLPMPASPSAIGGPLDVVGAFLQAWKERDASAIGRLFAEDADYVNVVGLWWTSRHSIERAHRRAFIDAFAESELRVEKVTYRAVGDDVAILHLGWELTGQVDPEGERSDRRRGILTLVMERNPADTWLIVSAHNTDIAPASDLNVAREGRVEPTSDVPMVTEDEPAEETAEGWSEQE